ncbi:prolyl oligopeptidase-like protein [Lojkania enalia]|uniref:Prolyl oligopeptidase-like protein n=1 Tax=Lojkania enalia TaxID=147567 RepID=A0A9P4MYV8_9PLEO|nr:prolyl oligopeptidase-like protein [Didymosphaeria enalia]
MHRFFKSEFFNFEFLRILSTAPYGGCEIGEALHAVSQIRDGDPESWSKAWDEARVFAEETAESAQRVGDKHGARAAFLRASNYARASQYMLGSPMSARDPRIISRLESSRELFRKGVSLLEGAIAYPLTIPFEKAGLPAYLYIPNSISAPCPLVVSLTGGDSTQEEIFLACTSAGLARGFALLTFDGPGQGILLKRDRLPLVAAYEEVLSVVLNHIEKIVAGSRHKIDLGRVAVVGHSLGAYFALRSAADPRIKACVAIDPPYNMWTVVTSRLPGWFLKIWEAGYLTDTMFDCLIHVLSVLNFQTKWEAEHLRAICGTESSAKAFKNLKNFSFLLADGNQYLDKIQCPVLVSGAAKSFYFEVHTNTEKIYKALGSLDVAKRNIWIAEGVEMGGLQAKIGAFELSNHRIFSFIDAHLRSRADLV